MTMYPRTRRRQAFVAMATLAIIVFMPEIELDTFDGAAAMNLAIAMVEPQAVD